MERKWKQETKSSFLEFSYEGEKIGKKSEGALELQYILNKTKAPEKVKN